MQTLLQIKFIRTNLFLFLKIQHESEINQNSDWKIAKTIKKTISERFCDTIDLSSEQGEYDKLIFVD